MVCCRELGAFLSGEKYPVLVTTRRSGLRKETRMRRNLVVGDGEIFLGEPFHDGRPFLSTTVTSRETRRDETRIVGVPEAARCATEMGQRRSQLRVGIPSSQTLILYPPSTRTIKTLAFIARL
jgi:hypothetical protein